MLICYHNEAELTQGALVHIAFLFSLNETITEIELSADFDDDEDSPSGYLVEVPFLRQVPLEVQVELLAETWSRYRSTEQVEATLLDAAIVYAAFRSVIDAVFVIVYSQGSASTILWLNHWKSERLSTGSVWRDRASKATLQTTAKKRSANTLQSFPTLLMSNLLN